MSKFRLQPACGWARHLRTFNIFRDLALMYLIWWIQEWFEWKRRPRTSPRLVYGIGFWFKRRGGGEVLEFCFSKMTWSFDLNSEILKPWFESQSSYWCECGFEEFLSIRVGVVNHGVKFEKGHCYWSPFTALILVLADKTVRFQEPG